MPNKTTYGQQQCDCLAWYSDGLKKCPRCGRVNFEYKDRRAAYNNLGSAPPWRGKKDTVEDVLKERKK